MKVNSATTTKTEYTPGGENLLAFETLELKACCARQTINDWEDYILVPASYIFADTKPAAKLGS